jgi:hypothetical protein
MLNAMVFRRMSFRIFVHYTTIYILIIYDFQPLSEVASTVPLVLGGLFATISVGLLVSEVPASTF